MYPMEVNYGVSSSKNIIPMFSKNPRRWLIRFVIGCGQFWFALRTAEETNDLDTRSVIRLVVVQSLRRHKQQSHCFQSVWFRIRRKCFQGEAAMRGDQAGR